MGGYVPFSRFKPGFLGGLKCISKLFHKTVRFRVLIENVEGFVGAGYMQPPGAASALRHSQKISNPVPIFGAIGVISEGAERGLNGG